MKSIELTEEHKSKLLEMCKVLFPNDKVDYIQDDTIKFLTNYHEKKHTDNPKITFGGWDEILHIHWFEFCMTHLFNKLIVEKYGYMSISDAISNGYYIIYNQNPVDYLYSEFKN